MTVKDAELHCSSTTFIHIQPHFPWTPVLLLSSLLHHFTGDFAKCFVSLCGVTCNQPASQSGCLLYVFTTAHVRGQISEQDSNPANQEVRSHDEEITEEAFRQHFSICLKIFTFKENPKYPVSSWLNGLFTSRTKKCNSRFNPKHFPRKL